MYKATANLLIVCFLCWMTGCSSTNTVSEDLVPTDYVNPFIGASTSVGAAGVYHGLGKTFPGATTPYGMVQVSPNTITGGDNGSGYSDEHKTIEGFAFTQMSGVGWFGDLGNFLVMPTTGELYKVAGKENNDSIKGYRSAYNKATETAKAGYYSVELTDYHIKVESSATPHCGILHFTYPSSDQSRIQIDLARRVGGTSTSQYVKVLDDHTIQGWMKCTPDGGGWGNGEGNSDYTVYYYAQFSKPLTNYGFWSADIPEHWVRKRDEVVSIPYLTRVSQAPVIKDKKELTGKHLGFFTEFPTKEGETVEMKVGISFVDMEGAANNFEQEIASKDFGQVKQEATELWNKELNRVRISGGTDDEKTIFYTAMYHTMIDPRIYTDVDGVYTADPRKVPKARKLKEITYDEMLDLATLGAGVLHNRSVEMAKKYGVPLVVRSSLNNSEGTVVKEEVTVERMLISGVALDTEAVRIAVIGLKDVPGMAFKLFDVLAKKHINVDVILQSIGRAGTKDISFTVDGKDLDDAIATLEENKARLGYQELHSERNIAKLSIVGAGMMSNPGVAAKMFESLYNEGVNINMISTSEIRVTVLINEKDGVRAMNAVHDAFNLAD